MVDWTRLKNSRGALVASGAVLLALGAAGGASAVQATRPSIEMAPTVQTPIARLATASGVVTVKGRVAEVYGDRFVMQDASGRAMVAMGHEGRGTVSVGQAVAVQGRYDDEQLQASYLVDQNGRAVAVGRLAGGPEGPGRPGKPGGPEGRPSHGPGGDEPPPPPPPGCAPVPGASVGRGRMPTPPLETSAAVNGATRTPPTATQPVPRG
jgi:uncharacterized protein YdeI (BOF family)